MVTLDVSLFLVSGDTCSLQDMLVIVVCYNLLVIEDKIFSHYIDNCGLMDQAQDMVNYGTV